MPSQRLINYLPPVLAVFFLTLAVVFIPSPVFAQALPSTVTPVYPPTVQGNTYTYTSGVVNSANAASINFPAPSNGPIYGQSTQRTAIGGGMHADVVVSGRPDKAEVAKAVGKFMLGVGGASLKVAGAVYAAYEAGKALNDLCNDLGYSCYKSPIGDVVVDKVGISLPAGFKYFGLDVWSSTKEAACGVAMSRLAPGNAGVFTLSNPTVLASGACQIKYTQVSNGAVEYQTAGTLQSQAAVPATPAPSSIADLEARIASESGWPSTSALPQVLKEAVASGVPLPMPAPYEVTGPSVVPMAPSVTVLPDGSKVIETPQKNVSYGPDSVTVTETSTRTSTSPSGVVSPVSTVTSAAPLPSPAPAPAEMPETCGYPGGPPCQIDEAGTPEPLPVGKYTPAADEYKTKADENRTTIGGNGDKPFFTGWNVFFFAPPLAVCQPFQLPDYNGASMGALDACNVVEGTRSVMSYIWALAALFLCLGMIKREV